MNLIRISIVVSLVYCLIGCAEEVPRDVLSTPAEGYIATEFPKDTSKLWIASGNPTNDTVILVGEGGPKFTLDFESEGRVYWEYLPHNKNYYYTVVHQASTYNKSIFDAKNFTLEDADTEIDNTAEMMYRAIKYFKDKGKYVVVFGHSYSAWVIPHYLATRPSLADKYFITGGRLKADSTQNALALRGVNSGFDADGRTLLIPDEDQEPNPNRTERYWQIRKNKERLKYAFGKTDYMKKLAATDLSNMVFYFGEHDQNVGALSPEEVDFLKAKGAIVAGVETNHYNIWKRVIDAFRANELSL